MNKKIIKDTLFYTLGTFLVQVIGVFTSILMRRYLTPEMMGIWSTFMLILNYSLFMHLGLFTAAEIRIPFLKGGDQENEIRNIRDITFTFCVIISIVVVVVIFLATALFKNKIPISMVFGFKMIALIIVATLFYNLYISFLRADKKFSLLSVAMTINSLSMLLSIITFVNWFKLNGLYLATLISTCFSLIYILIKQRYDLNFRFELKKAMSLIKIGVPLIIAGIIYTILLSIDKIIIIKMLGMKALGYYSIAILALTYTHTFPKILGIVMTPNIQEEYGKTNSRQRIIEYVKKPAIVMGYLFPFLLATVYFILPILVYYFMPKYVQGIISMKILLSGCFFISLVPLAQNYIIAINKQLLLVPMTIFAVFLGVIFSFCLIKLGYGINGVAFGISITYLVYFFISFSYVLKSCEKMQKINLFFLEIVSPFFYAVLIIFGIEFFLRINNILLENLIKFAIFCLLYLPALLIINKKNSIIVNMIEVYRNNKTFSALESEEVIV
jgi:O-antigen/teichoic acid export membrane protein